VHSKEKYLQILKDSTDIAAHPPLFKKATKFQAICDPKDKYKIVII